MRHPLVVATRRPSIPRRILLNTSNILLYTVYESMNGTTPRVLIVGGTGLVGGTIRAALSARGVGGTRDDPEPHGVRDARPRVEPIGRVRRPGAGAIVHRHPTRFPDGADGICRSIFDPVADDPGGDARRSRAHRF